MKKYLSEEFFKGLGKYIYGELLKPMAEEYVAKTSNSYDDMALSFLDDFIEDFLESKSEEE
jgi:hypothetical protein